MSILKRLFSDSIIYGVTKYLSIIASLFLTPIYTRILSKSDFGVMDIYNTWIALFIAILPLGFMNGLLRFYPESKNNLTLKKQYLGTIFTSQIIIIFIFLIFGYIYKEAFQTQFIRSSSYSFISILALLIISFSTLQNFTLTLCRIKEKRMNFLTISLTNFGILTGLGFYLVYIKNLGINGFFIASLAGLSISSIIGFFLIRNEIYFHFSMETFKKIFKYSIHFLSVMTLFQLTFIIDRYLINYFLSLNENGVYSIAVRISSMINFIISSFGLAWMPIVFNSYKKPRVKELFNNVFELYVFLGSFTIFGIYIFREDLLQFFAPNYLESMHVITILLIYNFVMGFTYVFTIGIQITKNTKLISTSAIFAISINIIISILLVNNMGLEGIAIGSLLGAFVWIIIQHIYSQKFYKVKYSYLTFVITITILMLCILFCEYIDFGASSITTKTIILMLLLIVLIKPLNNINRKTKKYLKTFEI